MIGRARGHTVLVEAAIDAADLDRCRWCAMRVAAVVLDRAPKPRAALAGARCISTHGAIEGRRASRGRPLDDVVLRRTWHRRDAHGARMRAERIAHGRSRHGEVFDLTIRSFDVIRLAMPSVDVPSSTTTVHRDPASDAAFAPSQPRRGTRSPHTVGVPSSSRPGHARRRVTKLTPALPPDFAASTRSRSGSTGGARERDQPEVKNRSRRTQRPTGDDGDNAHQRTEPPSDGSTGRMMTARTEQERADAERLRSR
jgi:hypothetical protein